MRGSRLCQRGFSLLEVLVAVAITALMLGVLYEIFGRSASTSRLRSEYATAITLAESLLASYPAGIQDGSVSLDKRFRTSVNTISFIDPGATGGVPRFNLVRVTTRVVWDSAGREHVVQLTTIKPVGVF